jgi:hypothetical protein
MYGASKARQLSVICVELWFGDVVWRTQRHACEVWHCSLWYALEPAVFISSWCPLHQGSPGVSAACMSVGQRAVEMCSWNFGVVAASNW